MTWQPIETAPIGFDEPCVLVYSEAGGIQVASCVYPGDPWYPVGGECPVHMPTHWMPLPEPPV